ncbi:MAG: ribonuclease H-like domain-containing protein [Pseudomonadota bacterium]|nr:ribonuclease H-like domain-containing protein [Pseudomonadota bacterium]
MIFDIEADGLLDDVTKIHCLVIKHLEGGKIERFNNQTNNPFRSVTEGLLRLEQAAAEGKKLIAHNGINYDIQVIRKLYPSISIPNASIVDTLVLSRLICPDLKDTDSKLLAAGKLPGDCYRSHSLKAWGYRLGNPKAEYSGGWEAWSTEMEDYCVQDVETLASLYQYLTSTPYSPISVQLEHAVAHIIGRQQRYGFLFDMPKATALYASLCQRRAELEEELTSVFTPRLLRSGEPLVPKVNNKSRGYTEGAAVQKLVVTSFNPGSRDHIYHWLHWMFGWVPTEFTDEGKPKVDETILESLDKYPEARLLIEYLTVSKRIGQLSEGKQAWFTHVKADGRIHGLVLTNGAVTGRMTHASPNMAQVPASYSPYGHDCRELFTVPFGKSLVGADASALELRCLAGYMAKYDEGAYIRTVTEGRKEDGTEIHTVNRKALEIDSRDDAKTWFLN